MNPYHELDKKSFWSPAVAKKNPFDISGLWKPKFQINKKDKIVTFGSCFAQHFGNALKDKGFSWFSAERPPYGMSLQDAQTFNYNIFSARTGNIYTTSLLLQWVEWALEKSSPPEGIYWKKNERYFDPFRPNIEPDGFESIEEMVNSRNACIDAFRESIEKSSVFVFTLGLTESWWHRDPISTELDYEYPMCPGTIAGEFDESQHVFVNQTFETIQSKLLEAVFLMRRINKKLKFLLTVSPVPLTATNSGEHVLVATSYSKSVLRAVAGSVVELRKGVDYFPSFEIISSFPYRGMFFEQNMRSVNKKGVAHVMDTFFSGLWGYDEEGVFVKYDHNNCSSSVNEGGVGSNEESDSVVCEEELLGAFNKGGGK